MTREKFETLSEELNAVKDNYFKEGVSLKGVIYTLQNSDRIDYCIEIFTNIYPFNDIYDRSHWHSVRINECNALSDVIDTLRKEVYYVMKFTHDDWKMYKKEKGLTNEDIANIVGLTADSVKNQTQPNKPLPKWVLSMLYEWKN